MLPLGLLMSDLLGWQPLVVEAKFNKELLTLGMLNLIFFQGIRYLETYLLLVV